MKTKIFAFVLCLICFFALVSLTSCSTTAPGDTVYSSEYVNFEILETCKIDSTTVRILVDKTTGVLYFLRANASGITPLYNADGSLKNIKDFE